MELTCKDVGYAPDANLSALTKRCKRSHAFTWLLRNVNLNVSPGSITVVTGPGGSGKSCLMRLLAGKLVPSTGTLQCKSLQQSQALVSIGYVSPTSMDTNVHRSDTVAEALDTIITLSDQRGYNSPQLTNFRAELLRALFLEHRAQTRAEHLSASERMRLELGCILAASPWVLLLDSITDYCSPAELQPLMELLVRLTATGTTIVLGCNHPSPLILQQATQLVIVAAGQLLYHGGPPGDCMAFFESVFQEHIAAPNPTAEIVMRLGRCLEHFREHLHSAATPPRRTLHHQSDDDAILLDRLPVEHGGDDEEGDQLLTKKVNGHGKKTIESKDAKHGAAVWDLQTVRQAFGRWKQPEAKVRTTVAPPIVRPLASQSAKLTVFVLQTSFLVGRHCRSAYRSSTFMPLCIGLLLCAVLNRLIWPAAARDELKAMYEQSNQLFLMLCVSALAPLLLVQGDMAAEKRQYIHEQSLRLYTLPAYAVADTLYTIVQALVLACPFLMLTPTPSYGSFYFVVVLYILVASNMIQAWMWLSSTNAQLCSMLTLFVWFMFGGSVVAFPTIPAQLRWIASLSPTQMAYSALLELTFNKDPALVQQFLQPPERTLAVWLFLLGSTWVLTRILFVTMLFLRSTPAATAPHGAPTN
jgi:ABC-type multidrug transport system ATPase subunit